MSKIDLTESGNKVEENTVVSIKKKISTNRTGFIVTMILAIVIGVISFFTNDTSIFSPKAQLILGMILANISIIFFLDMILGVMELRDFNNKEKDW